MPEILTPNEVAEYLKVHADVVYRLIREHKLVASRVGRSYRIPKEEIDRFIQSTSTRSKIRQTMFERVMAIAERNPGIDSDDVLAELEQFDQDRIATSHS